MKVRTLIVDDEPLARERIRSLLEEESDIEVVQECGDGKEAAEAILRERPDLVFLDVQMPEMTGFEVIEAVGPEQMPTVIFVTAYDEFALRAFEVHALDYILKPFDQERFERALQKARGTIHRQKNGDISERLRSLLEELRPRPRHLDRLVVRSGARITFLRTDEVEWIDAEGNYVRLHVGKKSYLLRETMSGIEAKLDPERFIRIHRSTIVNIECIKSLETLFQGEYVVHLEDGTKLTSSRGYRDRLHALMEASS
ncbi:MAG TPA: LytTR family DNA-binding domain-containing protein [Longimicrobiaceae bacterium]|nr:LytTR family DNA-binding domain-containing protein [Longimicrobiaceae bacterium]